MTEPEADQGGTPKSVALARPSQRRSTPDLVGVVVPVPWPLGFSTLGCPLASADEVVALAHRHGVGHVDLRAHPEGPLHVGLSAADRHTWRTTLDDAGVTVTTVASYVQLADGSQPTVGVVDAARRHLDLARDLGAEAVRVFTGGEPGTDTAPLARERLSAILDATPDSTARVLLETHDTLPRGRDVAAVLEGTPDRAGAIWDAVIAWAAGESPEDTASTLGGRIVMVQVKDARGTTPVMPGTGDVPLDRILAALRRLDWQGVLSLEWERAWFPDLSPLDDVLAATRSWLAEAWNTPTTTESV